MVTEGLSRLHGDLDILRSEFKLDIKEFEMSCTTFKEQLQKETEECSSEMELLTAKITNLEQSLKEEVEQNITLEQYTRRENLRFNNIKEHEGEDCKNVVYDISQLMKALNEHNLTQAKVKGRYLYINGERFSFAKCT